MRNGTHIARAACLAIALMASPAAVATTLDEARGHHGRGELDAALAAYEEITAHPEQYTAADRGTAHNNACVILQGKGAYVPARERCEAALTLRRGQQDKLRGLARTLNNLGLVHQQLGEFNQADARYREALNINREREDALAIAINTSNLGLLHTLAGDYGVAASYFDEAIAVADQHAGTPWARQQRALALINQGVALEKLGAYREALEVLRDVRDMVDALDERQRALLEVNLGVVYRNLGDPIAALEAFDEAKPLYEAMEDRSGLANAWLNSGIVKHLDLADAAAAQPDMQRSLEIAQRSGDRPQEIAALLALGRVEFALGAREIHAQAHFALARDLAEGTGSAEGRWSSLEGLARVARRQGDLTGALEYLREALAIVATVSTGVQSDALRSDFFGERRTVYELAVSVLAAQHAITPDPRLATEALAIARQAKARALGDALGQPALDGRNDGGRGAHALIEYFVAEGTLYRWVLASPAQVQLAAWEGDLEQLQQSAQRLYRELANGARSTPAALEALAAALLDQLPDAIGEAKALYIAPDAFLYRVPFDLLAMNGGQTMVEQTAVAILPSAGLLKTERSVRTVRGWAGFADPDTRGAASSAAIARQRLPITLDALPAPAMNSTGSRAGSMMTPLASRVAMRRSRR